ncbi:MAG: hypothetical protein R6V10_12250 [bacterium]
MSDVLFLLWPKWRSAMNGSRNRKERSKNLFLALLAVLFCFAVYGAFYFLLDYIENLNLTGQGLELETFLRFEINRRILGMVVLVFLAILIFSNIITSLTTFFLSEDLTLVGALPVSGDSIFLARYAEMLLQSSWMIVIFGTPVFVAFGAVYQAGVWYYLAIPAVLIPFLLIPAGIGVVVTMLLVYSFPARRIRDILLILSIVVAGILFVLLRLLQPEKLATSTAQMEVIEIIQNIQAPQQSWMPNYWAVQTLTQIVKGGLLSSGKMFLALLWSTGLGITGVALFLSRFLYPESFSKSQEATRTIISRTDPVNRFIIFISRPFRPATRQIVMKDIRVFMRDTTQWSQLFLLAALVVIYIFNFRVMPLSRFPMNQFKLMNFLCYLNIGLAGFVVTALSVRFVFPMVSQEGRAFWIIKSSPLSLKGFLWSKFLISCVPLLVIGEVLIMVTNYILEVSLTVWWISAITIALMTVAICGMGVGLGARFPRFQIENPTKVATSFGGVIYMIITMSVIGLVVLLEATPTYMYFISEFRGVPLTGSQIALIIGLFSIIVALLVLATIVPMKIGLKWLENLEL